MNCIEAEQMLSRRMDGDLDAEKNEMLESHLKDCPGCAEAQKAWSGIGDLLNASVNADSVDTDGVWNQIESQLGEQEPAASAPGARVLSFRMLTALAAVVILSLTVYLGRTSPAPDGPALAQSAAVEYFETDLPGASPMLYIDDDVGWTVVWVVEENASTEEVFQQRPI
jgi:anti-sigma factor RsiW